MSVYKNISIQSEPVVIKNKEKPALVVSENKQDIKLMLEKENILKAAKRQAEIIIQTAKENGYKEGYEKGYKEGHHKGSADAKEAVNTKAQEILKNAEDKLNHLLNDAKKQVDELCGKTEGDIVTLALAVSEKVLAILPEEKPAIENLVNRLLPDILADHIKVTVHPDDVKLLPTEKIEIESSDSIMRGGCLITTDYGTLNATIEQQFSVLKKAIMEEIDAAR